MQQAESLEHSFLVHISIIFYLICPSLLQRNINSNFLFLLMKIKLISLPYEFANSIIFKKIAAVKHIRSTN